MGSDFFVPVLQMRPKRQGKGLSSQGGCSCTNDCSNATSLGAKHRPT